MDIQSYLQEKRELVDSFLRSYFNSPFAPSSLSEAMSYSLFAGGKRIRPILAMASYEACGGAVEDITSYAAALEFIHTYSLIHDDLPAMDNDDLRRGMPTNHKVFGEGMAILAGDALLTEAFYLLSRSSPAKGKARGSALMMIIRDLAMAAGAHGMVAGQAGDILAEDNGIDGDNLAFIHVHKTGALITASVRMGAFLSGAGKKKLVSLTKYGESIGLAFQIIDDILDIRGNTDEMGKTTGSDKRKKKATYPALYGIDSSMAMAEKLVEGAIHSLKDFSREADPLREMAHYVLSRRN